eukprot:COSAG02_NODE_3768_length_6264_cov_5.702676_4_plen_166_part_00
MSLVCNCGVILVGEAKLLARPDCIDQLDKSGLFEDFVRNCLSIQGTCVKSRDEIPRDEMFSTTIVRTNCSLVDLAMPPPDPIATWLEAFWADRLDNVMQPASPLARAQNHRAIALQKPQPRCHRQTRSIAALCDDYYGTTSSTMAAATLDRAVVVLGRRQIYEPR